MSESDLILNVVRCGDCLDVMASMPENSIDSIITDPPYGLKFMGKDWDKGVPGVHFWQAALRVAKPGAFLMAFGGDRTHHRLMTAVEDAGWEIRDTLCWLYGQGFPKSYDISKGIDKAAGAEREILGYHSTHINRQNTDNWNKSARPMTHSKFKTEKSDTSGGGLSPISPPATPEAQQWDGWGTALKPAWEPILCAMKPLDGTFAENALKWGVAGLNIDGCRIAHASAADLAESANKNQHTHYANPNSNRDCYSGSMPPRTDYDGSKGRWPANLILDEEAARMLDEQSGVSKSRVGKPRGTAKKGMFANAEFNKVGTEHNDSGGASRFFFCAKASRSERDAGLEQLPDQLYARSGGAQGAVAKGQDEYIQNHIGLNRISKVKNIHPTVKPLALMEWLCKLTQTPTGGIVLDPFCGSGSTLIAARRVGRPYIGIDNDPKSVSIAWARLAGEASR